MTIVGATPFLILNFIFLLWLYHCMVVASFTSFHLKLKSSRMTQQFCFKGEIAKLVMVDKVLCSNKLRRERSRLKEVWTGFTKEILHTYVPSFPPQVIPLRITKLRLCSISLLVKTPSTKRLQRPKGKLNWMEVQSQIVRSGMTHDLPIDLCRGSEFTCVGFHPYYVFFDMMYLFSSTLLLLLLLVVAVKDMLVL